MTSRQRLQNYLQSLFVVRDVIQDAVLISTR